MLALEKHIILILTALLCFVQSQFDETITKEDGQVPPCPPSTDGRGYLRFKADLQCYQANTRGPCGENMILYAHPSNGQYGFCDCFDARGESALESSFLNSRSLSHCIEEIRGQIFVPERNRCYSAFDQGPCPDGKWLVLNGTNYPVCAKNTCPSKANTHPLSTKFSFAISSTSKCYQTMSKGYCGESYQLRFASNHFLPQCRYIPLENERSRCPPPRKTTEVRRLHCKPGSRYDHLTKCTTSINPRK